MTIFEKIKEHYSENDKISRIIIIFYNEDKNYWERKLDSDDYITFNDFVDENDIMFDTEIVAVTSTVSTVEGKQTLKIYAATKAAVSLHKVWGDDEE